MRAAAWAGLAVLVLVGIVGVARLLGVDAQGLLPGGSPVATVAAEEEVAAGGSAEPVEEASPPGAGTDSSADDAGTPVDEAGTPVDEAGTPVDEAGAPVDEAGAPVHETDGSGDEALLSTVQGLVDARALAWEEGDPGLLASVTAEGSPALAAEADALDRAREQGVRYSEVSFRVERAVLVEEAEGRLTVDAAVARAPLTGTDSAGETVLEEPGTTERVRLVLARDEGGWLLWSWAPQDDSSTR